MVSVNDMVDEANKVTPDGETFHVREADNGEYEIIHDTENGRLRKLGVETRTRNEVVEFFNGLIHGVEKVLTEDNITVTL